MTIGWSADTVNALADGAQLGEEEAGVLKGNIFFSNDFLVFPVSLIISVGSCVPGPALTIRGLLHSTNIISQSIARLKCRLHSYLAQLLTVSVLQHFRDNVHGRRVAPGLVYLSDD